MDFSRILSVALLVYSCIVTSSQESAHSPQPSPSGSHQQQSRRLPQPPPPFSSEPPPPFSSEPPPPFSSEPPPPFSSEPPPPFSSEPPPPFSSEPPPPFSSEPPPPFSSEPPPPFSSEPPPPFSSEPPPPFSSEPPPPFSSEPPPPFSSEPPPPFSSEPPPPFSSEPPPPFSSEPPPPFSSEPPPPFSSEPPPPFSSEPPPPFSSEPPPPFSSEPPPPFSSKPPPPFSSEPPPPFSSEPPPPFSSEPSTSCPPNSDYRKPIATLTEWRSEETNTSSLLAWWYYPQLTSNVQIAIEYTILRENHFFSCDDEQSRTVHNNDLEMSSVTGQCTLQIESASPLETYAVRFGIDDKLEYAVLSIESKNQWMHDGKELFGDLSLFELVIPGTHESAAYATPDAHSGLEKSEDIQPEALHQTRSIENQLQDGIRYLDFRPARFGNGETREYVLMNGHQKMVSLSVVAEQINNFIENSREIVIVSFRDFPQGFEHRSDHKVFINYLKELFGEHVYTYQPITPSMNDIWQSNRRLVLLYHDPIYEFGNFLWPGIPQIEKNFEISKNESSNERPNRKRGLQAVIPQLLPEGQDLRNAIENLSTSTFNWATGVGRSDVNIIAVDYYEATGVVDFAIQFNEELASEETCTEGSK